MAPHRHALPDGRTLDNTQLAKELGISRQTLICWLKTDTLAGVLQRQPTRHALLTMPDGRQVRQRHLAKELAVTESALCQRRRRGWSHVRCVTAGRQAPQRAVAREVSTLVWCKAHNVVLTRSYVEGWTWEPLRPGMVTQAKAYAEQFGYVLRITTRACPQCAQEQAA